MSTIKIHLLGYAPYYIKLYGPLDMLSTMKVGALSLMWPRTGGMLATCKWVDRMAVVS